MNFHVLTLFPEMIEQTARTSIIGRAVKSGHISLEAVNIRDYTDNKHKKVDDYPYGGGAGMLMQAQPVYDAFEAVKQRISTDSHKLRVVYLTPQGKPFCQKAAEELSEEKDVVFLCGHYEGIDERVLEEIVTDYISIGDYVLTGGELPAMVMIDAIARLVPGVLNNETSADFETFYNDLLEYPQYSRPEEWHGKRVPEILLSGDHVKIRNWRLEQSIRRTKERRPDLSSRFLQKQVCIDKLLKKNKVLYMDMAENLQRGRGELIYFGQDGAIVRDSKAKTCMLAVFDDKSTQKIIDMIESESEEWQYVVHQESLLEPMRKKLNVKSITLFRQAVYTKKSSIKISKDIEFRVLGIEDLKEIMEHYHMIPNEDYIKGRLLSGDIMGAFVDGEIAGFAGTHAEGSIGMLEVYEKYRRRGIAAALESYMINSHLTSGYTPYGDVVPDNQPSLQLQEKLGLIIGKDIMYWVVADGKDRKEIEGEL